MKKLLVLLGMFFGLHSEKIEIVPYNALWPQLYEKEALQIRKALGDNCLEIHHIGSTSVPRLAAKPKIDILAVVKDLDINVPPLEKLDFEAKEAPHSGRYFSKKTPRVHLHIFKEGDPFIRENLAFRDWLRTHEEDRKAYEKLKKELALQYQDGMSYCKAKTEFVKKILAKSFSQP